MVQHIENADENDEQDLIDDEDDGVGEVRVRSDRNVHQEPRFDEIREPQPEAPRKPAPAEPVRQPAPSPRPPAPPTPRLLDGGCRIRTPSIHGAIHRVHH